MSLIIISYLRTEHGKEGAHYNIMKVLIQDTLYSLTGKGRLSEISG